MKFLVSLRRREGVPVPPEAVAGILMAQRDWIREKLDEGVFDCAYVLAQGSGGIAIVNARSGEELSAILTEAPSFPIVAIDVQLLADVATLENATNALQRMTASVG